jgi:hypothetical protein
MRAGLNVCRELKGRGGDPNDLGNNISLSQGPGVKDYAFFWGTEYLTKTVKEVLEFFIRSLGTRFCDVKSTLRLSIVLASVQPVCSAEAVENAMWNAAMEVLRACLKRPGPPKGNNPPRNSTTTSAAPFDGRQWTGQELTLREVFEYVSSFFLSFAPKLEYVNNC